MSANSYEVIADWLDAEAAKVRTIENSACSALYDKKDEKSYRELMRQKAMLLASLADDVTKRVELLKDEDKAVILERVGRFSSSASNSLEIGSVFFMSALLYPDDYKEGFKNDLEKFAETVRSMS